MAFNWRCPFCEHNSTITGENFGFWFNQFDLGNKYGGTLGVSVRVIVCPNKDCHETTIRARFGAAGIISGSWQIKDLLDEWQLRPSSMAKVLPEYIPAPIREDYDEACKIRDLSPKASATLSRRCLQGIIRDYWGTSKPRLVDEIISIKDKVDPDTWDAIDAVRRIGNIGAHMEKDINVVIDVDPDEAQLLIGLIETLIEDWYIARHKRQLNRQQIIAAAEAKKHPI